MGRSQEASALLACVALALLVLMALAINLARVGSAIAREVQRAQISYLRNMGSGEAVENNALVLGQCLRREMLKSAHAGFVHPDTWAVATRVKALPGCADALPPIPLPRTPVITAPRVRPIVTSATPRSAPRRPTPASAGPHAD